MNDRGLTKGGKRREQILELLKRQGKVTVQEIIDTVRCSEATARRDLDRLAEQGQAIRTIGGAQLEGMPAAREVSFFEKKQVLWVEKEAIARKAASMVSEGDVVGLTGGTTTFLIARALKGLRGVTVVTNAVNIAMELADAEAIQVVLTGGVMRPNSFELCGPLAEKIIQSLNINLMFMGIDGVTAKQGYTTYSELEADIARLMMERAVRTYPVFDHTKVGRASLFSIAPLDAADGCVTDRIPDEELLKRLQEYGIPVLYGDISDR